MVQFSGSGRRRFFDRGGSSEKAEECVAKLNDYLTARGYGREAAFRNRENGGTDIIWYKDACQVKITLLPQGTFKFMAAMGPSYVYEPEMLLGKWEGYRQDSGENYIMTLDFVKAVRSNI